jgi:hypothetical protein
MKLKTSSEPEVYSADARGFISQQHEVMNGLFLLVSHANLQAFNLGAFVVITIKASQGHLFGPGS